MTSDASGYEPTDVAPSLLGLLVVGTIAFLALVPLGLMLVYPAARQPAVTTLAVSPVNGPRLQLNAANELASFRASEDERLSMYGWIDRDRKIVHIPIERAMSLVEQRGLAGSAKP